MATRRMLETAQIQAKAEVARVNEALSGLKNDNFMLSESLTAINLMIDERGWVPMFDIQRNGLTLVQLNSASKQLRELVIGNPVMKRGSQLRTAYVWGKDVDIEFTTGAPAQLKIMKLVAQPANQACLFSPDAQAELERTAYTDGNFFAVGENATKKLNRVGMSEISGVYADPDFHENVIAIRRSWMRMANGAQEQMHHWFYVDTYDGPRASTIHFGGNDETVDVSKTMFWMGYNRQIGWIWGVPDALPAIAWSKLYREFLISGSVMSKALAQIAYKLTAKTSQGAAQASAQIRDSAEGGQTAGIMNTMDLAPLSSAGKGYDFDSGEPLSNMIAVGLGLTVEELLGQPNSDKADGIAGTTKREMRLRQKTQAAFIRRVLVWMGSPFDKTEVEFPDIDDVDSFRQVQSISSAWGTGLFSPEEIRDALADVAEIELDGDVPSGVMIPNNESALTLAASLTPAPAAAADKGAPAPKADGSNSMSNGQGRDNQKKGTLSAGNNDLRDGIARK